MVVIIENLSCDSAQILNDHANGCVFLHNSIMVVYLWIQIHTNPITFRAMVLTALSIMHVYMVSECLLQVMMGRTIMSATPSVQWKNILVLQIMQNHC